MDENQEKIKLMTPQIISNKIRVDRFLENLIKKMQKSKREKAQKSNRIKCMRL